MDRAEFKKIAREGFKLTHLTEKRLDEMYDQAGKAIEAYKATHPMEWAQAEEEDQQRQQREVK